MYSFKAKLFHNLNSSQTQSCTVRKIFHFVFSTNGSDGTFNGSNKRCNRIRMQNAVACTLPMTNVLCRKCTYNIRTMYVQYTYNMRIIYDRTLNVRTIYNTMYCQHAMMHLNTYIYFSVNMRNYLCT